jgi:hypothetical protein
MIDRQRWFSGHCPTKGKPGFWPDDHLVRVLLGDRHALAGEVPVASPDATVPEPDRQADILAVLLRIEQRVDDIARILTPT